MNKIAKIIFVIILILFSQLFFSTQASASVNHGCSSMLNGNFPESRRFLCSQRNFYTIIITMECKDVFNREKAPILQSVIVPPGGSAVIRCPDKFPYSGNVFYTI